MKSIYQGNLQRGDHAEHQQPDSNGHPYETYLGHERTISTLAWVRISFTSSAAIIQAEPVREQHVLPRGLQDRHEADNAYKFEVTAQFLGLAHAVHVGCIHRGAAFVVRDAVVVAIVLARFDRDVILGLEVWQGGGSHGCG